jgi:hypothetical protein
MYAAIKPANSSTAALATRASPGRTATAAPFASSSKTATKNAIPNPGSVRMCSGTSPAWAPALAAQENANTLAAARASRGFRLALCCMPG